MKMKLTDADKAAVSQLINDVSYHVNGAISVILNMVGEKSKASAAVAILKQAENDALKSILTDADE